MATLQIFFAEYLVPLSHASPLDGSLVLQELQDDDPEDTNDLRFLIVASGNVTGLNKTGITLSDGTTLVSLIGKNSCYEMVLRPPSGSDGNGGFEGEITITIAENAVLEGNTETSITLPYSDAVPESAWQDVFMTAEVYNRIITVTADHIEMSRASGSNTIIDTLSLNGTLQSNKQITIPNQLGTLHRYTPQKYLFLNTNTRKMLLIDTKTGVDWESEAIFQIDPEEGVTAVNDIAISENGELIACSGPITDPVFGKLAMAEIHQGLQTGKNLALVEFEKITLNNGEIDINFRTPRIATQGNRLYIAPTGSPTVGDAINTYDLMDSELQLGKQLNIPGTGITTSIFVYEDHLYHYNHNSKHLSKVDLRTVLLPKPHTTIYPQPVQRGNRVDLRKFAAYANKVVYDVGFNAPDFVSIEDNRWLVIADDAPDDATAYLRLRAINQNGISAAGTFEFYIYMQPTPRPEWKDFQRLTLQTGQTVNLFEYVENASEIKWQYGFTVPTGVTLSDGQLTATATGEMTLVLRASNDAAYFQDHSFTIITIDRETEIDIDAIYRYRVLIEGIDVSGDLKITPVIENSVDYLKLNAYIRGDCAITLTASEGKYNPLLDANFWTENGLNRSGYLNKIQVYLDTTPAGGTPNWTPHLLFEGFILKLTESIKAIEARLECADVSYSLRQTTLNESGVGLTKVAQLNANGGQLNEGEYRVPEEGLLPLDVNGVQSKAYAHADRLTLKRVANLLEGVSIDNSGYLETDAFKTQGGALADPVLLQFKTAFRRVPIASALAKIGILLPNLNIQSDVFEPEVDAHIQSNGNIASMTEDGRTLRYPIGWVADETNAKTYILLTNPSAAIGDRLMQYNRGTRQWTHLHTFPSGYATLQVATDDYDTFYVLAATATDTETDWSDPELSRQDTVGNIKYPVPLSKKAHNVYAKGGFILQYTHSTRREAVLVEPDTAYLPQIAMHYHAGFDSEDLQWQGITTQNTAGFYVREGYVYYRYAKGTDFGIARVAVASGMTESVIWAEKDEYFNHLNFAFTLDADDNVVFAYTQGTTTDSTIIVKKKEGTTETTLLSERRTISQLTDLDTVGGAFLGVYEVVIQEDRLYLRVPIARKNRDIDKAAGCAVYRFGIGSYHLETLKTWEFVQWGPVSLTPHNENIYFLEAPTAFYQFEARNSDLTEKLSEMRAAVRGFLNYINPDGVVEQLGSLWYEDAFYVGAVTPILVDGEDLHFVMASASPDTLLHADANVAHHLNMQWLTWTKQLRFLVDVPTEGSVYDALTRIAEQVNATFSVAHNMIKIQTRTPIGALVNGVFRSNGVQIPYDNANRVFPESGYLLIEKEVIQYSRKTDTHFTGLTRGLLGTEVVAHADNTEILFLDYLFVSEANLDIQVQTHWTHLYNVVTDSEFIRIEDTASKTLFGEKALTLNLGVESA